MNKTILTNIRDRLQGLLDNHQLQGTGLDTCKMIMVELSALISTTPGEPDNGQAPEPATPAAPIAPAIDAELAQAAGALVQRIAADQEIISYYLAKLLAIEEKLFELRQQQATANDTPAQAAPVAPPAAPAAPAAQPAA